MSLPRHPFLFKVARIAAVLFALTVLGVFVSLVQKRAQQNRAADRAPEVVTGSPLATVPASSAAEVAETVPSITTEVPAASPSAPVAMVAPAVPPNVEQGFADVPIVKDLVEAATGPSVRGFTVLMAGSKVASPGSSSGTQRNFYQEAQKAPATPIPKETETPAKK